MLILGHRGAILETGAFSENSLRAFEEAIETADGFETDACVDKDGEVFLLHEADVIGAEVKYTLAPHLNDAGIEWLGRRRFDQLSTQDVRSLRLKDGSPIPTLRQAIELVGARPGKVLNIELKSCGVASYVLRILNDAFRAGTIRPDAVLLSSFDHTALPEIREQAPGLRIGAIMMSPETPSVPLYPWKPGSLGRYEPLNEATLDSPLLRKVRPDVFVMPEKCLTVGTAQMIGVRYPAALLAGWGGRFELAELLKRLETLKPSGKVASLIIDNPRKYAVELRKIA